jgi:hypothetical protein
VSKVWNNLLFLVHHCKCIRLNTICLFSFFFCNPPGSRTPRGLGLTRISVCVFL